MNDPHRKFGQRAIWTRAQSAGLLLESRMRAQHKFDPFVASNRHEKCSYGRYEFKDEKQ